MKSRIEAVIFDWAGTTVDYGCFAPVQAFIAAFEQYGIAPTIEEVRKPMGMLKRDHVRTMMEMERIRGEWKRIHGADFTEEDVEAVYLASEAGILDILTDYAEPKPYVLDTVKWLKDNGIAVGSTTGYTDEMMDIVVPCAKEKGYVPDYWCSPNAVGNVGRPYPYMVFQNMRVLGIHDVAHVIKVGDTVSDIKEGKAAGAIAVGVIEGSSVMALNEEEYKALSKEEQDEKVQRVREVFVQAGADYVIRNMSELPALIEMLA